MADTHARLSELMQARRLQLGMKTWRALAAEADIAYETLRAMRAGQNVAPGTIHAVEKALRWTPGSIEAILAGGEPGIVGEASVRLTQQTALTARGTVEPPARPDPMPEDTAELVKMALRYLDDSREHQRRSQELYSRAEQILRRLTGTDESADRDAG